MYYDQLTIRLFLTVQSKFFTIVIKTNKVNLMHFNDMCNCCAA